MGASAVVLIVQARMDSTRLPGKSLRPLAGVPLGGRILERLKRCQRVDRLVLAVPDTDQNDALEVVGRSYGIPVFRGSEPDVLDRYYRAAQAFRAEAIVRFPADNPVPEPSEIDRIIAYHLTGQSDFSSNLAEVYGNGYPNGIGAEVISAQALEEVWRACQDPEKREHPHLNFFDYRAQRATDPDRYRVGTVPCPPAFRRPELVLDVNTPQEYAFMAALYDALYPGNPQFHITDIIRWYDAISRRTTTPGRLPAAVRPHG